MNTYLIWLEWPEKCFRADAEALRLFKSLVPPGSRVVRARGEAEFLRELPRATHAVVWNFDRAWFALAPRLKVLATPAAGRELVPTEGPQGVTIHFGAFHGPIISETVLGFLLAWSRGFFRRDPLWPRSILAEHCHDLQGTTAVIAGFGRIGRAIAARLEPFGVACHGLTRHLHGGRRHLSKADWLIVALPSDTGTDDFVNGELIARLPKKCVVINVGRGNAVDEAALLAALAEGRLAGAYLDVFKNEPTPLNPHPRRSSVNLATRRKVPWNLIRMPHASAFSSRYLRECFLELKRDGLI